MIKILWHSLRDRTRDKNLKIRELVKVVKLKEIPNLQILYLSQKRVAMWQLITRMVIILTQKTIRTSP